MNDGHDCFKATVPAQTEEQAAEYVKGNGEIIAIKKADLQDIDCDTLRSTLLNAGYDQQETHTISRLIEVCGLMREN